MNELKDRLRQELSEKENILLRALRETEDDNTTDPRWLSIARTHLELAFMAWKRGLYEGKRVGDG